MTDREMIECGEKSRQIERLRAIMHRLRAPGGCPWDAEQTHESLISNLIEEAYETVDTIRRGDREHLREELGDLLLQVVFHSELAAEDGAFDLDEVARGISEKLVRRHPHVFGDSAAEGTEAVLKQWDEIKRTEKGNQAETHLHGVGQGLPALLRAAKLQKKAAKVGFDWPDETGVLAKIREELGELDEALERGDAGAAGEELGDLLFSAVNLARTRKLDPELVMAAANAKFERRFAAMEAILRERGEGLADADLAAMEAAWQTAKTRS
jgi:MazG family protein